MADLQGDLEAIDTGLIALYKSSFQHRSWEQLQRESGLEIDRPGAAILKVLAHRNEACKMMDVANQLGIEAPSVTRKVQQLEADGFLSRRPDSRDRRVSQLRMTGRGRQQLKRMQAYRHKQLAQVFAQWDATDRAKLADLLRRLTEQLESTNQPERK